MIISYLLSLIPYAGDPVAGAWADWAQSSFVVLVLVTVVLASFRGWITWPKENERKDKLIDKLVEENLNWQRVTLGDTLPMIGRTVTQVKAESPQTPDSQAVLRDLQAAVAQLTRAVTQDEQ